jgi:hypothetical protein
MSGAFEESTFTFLRRHVPQPLDFPATPTMVAQDACLSGKDFATAGSKVYHGV